MSLHTASETGARQKKRKKAGSVSIFCVYESVACILIGRVETDKLHALISLLFFIMWIFQITV